MTIERHSDGQTRPGGVAAEIDAEIVRIEELIRQLLEIQAQNRRLRADLAARGIYVPERGIFGNLVRPSRPNLTVIYGRLS